MPRNVSFLLRAALEILDEGSLRAWSVQVVEICTIVFLGGHFLFTCSDTFAV